jgi:hypothetical protein
VGGVWGDLLRGHMRGAYDSATVSDLENDASVTASSGLCLIRMVPRSRPNPRSTTRADALPLLFNERTTCQSLLKSTRERQTLSYFLILRTTESKAWSTLLGCLVDISMKMHPRCFASSRPSA